MAKMEVSIPKRKPDVMAEAEYEAICNLFSQGSNRAQIIKKLGYDKNWYYNRLSKDPKLKLAEQRGYDICIDNLPKDIAVGVKKSLIGHTHTVKKRMYEYVSVYDENGVESVERVLKQEVEEEKYYPPNAAIINAVGRQVISSMKESDNTTNDIDKRIGELSDDDIDAMYKVAQKVLSKT